MLARHTAATPAVAAGLAASSVLVVRQCDKCIFGKVYPSARLPAAQAEAQGAQHGGDARCDKAKSELNSLYSSSSSCWPQRVATKLRETQSGMGREYGCACTDGAQHDD
jgi:hypothetical protein